MTTLVATGSFAAANNVCPKSTPSFRLKEKIIKAEILQDISSRELTEKRSKESTLSPRDHVLGITHSNLETAISARFSAKGSNDSFCVELTDVEMEFIARPVVHIANDFKKGSCEYRKILNHENKHVRTTNAFVRRYKSKLGTHIRKSFKNLPSGGPVTRKGTESLQQQYLDFIQQAAKEYLEKVYPELIKAQAKIDTPEEYAKTAKKCGGKWQDHLSNE